MAAPLLLAVDGDALVHRAHHAMAGSDHRDTTGAAVWGLRGLVTFLAGAAARLRPDAVLVGFDSRAPLRRAGLYPAYKAHRPAKPADLVTQLEAAPALLAAGGVPVVVAAGAEADDVLASAARVARSVGWRTVLLTGDRDAFALLDATTSVLWLRRGGVGGAPLVDPVWLEQRYGVTPAQYPCFAALRGDPSDNLPGVRGVGTVLAARLVQAFGSAQGVFDAVDGGRGEEIEAVTGPGVRATLAGAAARAEVERNRVLMRHDDSLDLPDVEALRLPLDGARLREALRTREIRLGPSLWALAGEPMPAWLAAEQEGASSVIDLTTGGGVVRGWRPVARWRPVVTAPGQLALF